MRPSSALTAWERLGRRKPENDGLRNGRWGLVTSTWWEDVLSGENSKDTGTEGDSPGLSKRR